MVEKTFTITDPAGMHARPASALVGALTKFQSDISLEFGGKTVNLKSILGVMSLGIPPQSVVKITANGADEDDAMATISQVLQSEGISNK